MKAILILLACWRCAYALNPSLDISQYAHTAWTVREGFFKGNVSAITQTLDGYLWLGTQFGLFRFDGVRKVQLRLRAGEHLPSDRIFGLLADRDGRLWIGTSKGLASWKDGKLSGYPELAGQAVYALLQDRQGTVWASAQAGPTGRLCAIQGSSVRCKGEDGSFGLGIISLYEDSRGNLWAGANSGLWRWSPGPPRRYSIPDAEPHGLIEGDNGALWIGLRGGIRQLVNGKVEAYPLPGVPGNITPLVSFGIAMVGCGSQPGTVGFCICTRAGQIFLTSPTVYRATLFRISTRTGKAIFGRLRATAWTAFAISLFPRFL